MKPRIEVALAAAVALSVVTPATAAALPAALCDTTTPLTVLTFNDFHGRLAATNPNTIGWFGTIEEQRAAAGEANTLVVSGGDNVGASLFTSFAQNDEPTIDLLNTLDVDAAAAGNHEFDQGWPDLRDRIGPRSDFPYLAANVVITATGQSALPGYAVIEKAGLRIGVVGAVTGDLPSLVSPAGLTGLTVVEPVPAMNTVIGQLKDGDDGNGEADVVVAVVHEGAPVGGQPLAQNVAASAAFASIVNDLDDRAQVVVNAHTHQVYAWDAPVAGGTRPLIQSGSYASNVGRVTLNVDATSGASCSYTSTMLPVTTTPNATLIANFPRVAAAKSILDAALAKAAEVGQQVIGSADEAITRALTTNADGSISDDRARESTMSNLVAQMFADVLGEGDPNFIGLQNPGGTRADFNVGSITYAEAAAVLPFANTLMTTRITGAQFKTVLEQQWQRDSQGNVPSRPYLQLGLSRNVTYTYDASRPEGDRITSIIINNKPVQPKKRYTVGSGSFLIAGGDNFRELAKGVNTADTGRADLEAWVSWIREQATVEPSYRKQAVSVHPLPTTLRRGRVVSFQVGAPKDELALDTLDFKSNGLRNDNVIAWLHVNQRTWWGRNRAPVGYADVEDGRATVRFRVPRWVKPGKAVLVVRAYDSVTAVRIPVTIRR